MTTRESVAVFGPGRRLVGVVAVPDAPVGPRPAVVIINAGIINRAGPNRIYVRLARALAEAGHWVLRFDLGGIGDSGPPSDGTSVQQSAFADIGTAMEYLGDLSGAKNFILCGLCSGADQSLMKAAWDPRVSGVIALDPTMFRTKGFYLRTTLRGLVRPSAWWRLLTGRYGVVRQLRAALSPNGNADATSRPSPGASRQARSALQTLTERGTHLCFVFTGGHKDYCYRNQLTDYFGGITFGDTFRLEYLPDSSHTFSAEDHKVLLEDIAVGFVRGFGSPGSQRLPQADDG